MSSVSIWVLSILGIIVLSILIDVILPNGNSSSFIKNIFGYLIIIVVLSPVFSFFTNKDHNLTDVFETSSVVIQENFVAKVNRQILDSASKNIKDECHKIGIKAVNIGFEADIFQNKLNIKNVNVDLTNAVIDSSLQHTNIKTTITDIILKIIVVDKEIIVFYE